MTEAAPRSARAEKARDWFWTTLGISQLLNLCVHVFGLDFLKGDWSVVLRIALAVAWTVSGVVWAWETDKRRNARGEE